MDTGMDLQDESDSAAGFERKPPTRDSGTQKDHRSITTGYRLAALVRSRRNTGARAHGVKAQRARVNLRFEQQEPPQPEDQGTCDGLSLYPLPSSGTLGRCCATLQREETRITSPNQSITSTSSSDSEVDIFAALPAPKGITALSTDTLLAEQEARLQQVQHHQSKMAKFRSEEEEDMAEATAMEAHDTAMRPFYDQCKEMRRQLRAEGEYNDAEWGSPSSSVAGDGPEQHNGDPIMHAT